MIVTGTLVVTMKDVNGWDTKLRVVRGREGFCCVS